MNRKNRSRAVQPCDKSQSSIVYPNPPLTSSNMEILTYMWLTATDCHRTILIRVLLIDLAEHHVHCHCELQT